MLPRTDTVLSLLPLRRACPDHGAAVRILDSLPPSARFSPISAFLLALRSLLFGTFYVVARFRPIPLYHGYQPR